MHLLYDISDDTPFLEMAVQAVNAATALAAAQFVHIVKIDSWFGDRWYSFSGKILGAAGVRRRRLTVPPFHPHRVVREVRYRAGDPAQPIPLDRPLHKLRSSESNLRNFIDLHGDSITFAWISGNTASTGRGAIMVYNSSPQGAAGWYVGFERKSWWRAVKFVETDPPGWTSLVGGGSAAR